MTNYKSSSSCPIPLCASCKIARLTCQTPSSSKVLQNPSQLMALRSIDLTVGQTSSLGHLPKSKEPTAMQYTSGTLFVDHCKNLCLFITK